MANKTCIVTGQSDKHAVCEICKFRSNIVKTFEHDGFWNYVTVDQLAKDTLALANSIPDNCSGIVGISRSGILPATILALHLQLPLYSLYMGTRGAEVSEIKPQLISRGGKESYRVGNGPKFIVDDTVHSGSCMKVVKATTGYNSVYATVYTTPELKDSIDCYSKILKSPHLLEWNLFNNNYVSGGLKGTRYHGGMAFDFDGVLCLDPKPGEEHTDHNVWISNLKPTHMLPRRHTIPLIITMRLEAWRKATEDWLKRYQVKCDKLLMCPANSIAERDSNFAKMIVSHKAESFKKSDCFMMVESDEMQARIISEYSKKPVLCTGTKTIIQ